jgi:methyltransferase
MGPIKAQASYKKDDVPTATWLEYKKEKKARKAKKRDKLLEGLEKTQEDAAAAASALTCGDEEEQAEQKPHQEGRLWTVSIALPGNILDNAQTPELRAALAGQIARAAAIFNADEVKYFFRVMFTRVSFAINY